MDGGDGARKASHAQIVLGDAYVIISRRCFFTTPSTSLQTIQCQNIISINFIMSLRRKSCEACFKGRRKCHLSYPTCKRCHNNQKTCHYIGSPLVPSAGTSSRALSEVFSLSSFESSEPIELLLLWQSEDDVWDSFNWLDGQICFEQSIIPSFLGNLGELQPVFGNTKSWEWVIKLLKDLQRSL